MTGEETTDVLVIGERLRPSNRLRIFYEGEPEGARVELIVMGDDGIESVHDVPFDAVTVHLASRGRARIVLDVGDEFVTVHAEGDVDNLKEQLLERIVRLPPAVTFGIGKPPIEKRIGVNAQAGGICTGCGELLSQESVLAGVEHECITKTDTPKAKERKR